MIDHYNKLKSNDTIFSIDANDDLIELFVGYQSSSFIDHGVNGDQHDQVLKRNLYIMRDGYLFNNGKITVTSCDYPLEDTIKLFYTRKEALEFLLESYQNKVEAIKLQLMKAES